MSTLPVPALELGPGCRHRLATWLKSRLRPSGGDRPGPVLLVRGGASLDRQAVASDLLAQLHDEGFDVRELRVHGEPEARWLEAQVDSLGEAGISAVVAVGGGSALDTGKGLAGLLAVPGNLLDYLEGVGRGMVFPGRRLPLVSMPTTAGTGSESTSNAVFGEQGPEGYKKSLRHPSLVPDLAILDPELQRGMPAEQTAACGMDALTQCIESLLSTRASRHSDNYARQGIESLAFGLPRAVANGDDLAARAACAYGAFCSGVALSHAGLGIVHGFAPVLGSRHGVPHGVACGRVMAAANRATVVALRARAPQHPALERYAWLGRTLTGRDELTGEAAVDAGLQQLSAWTTEFGLPSLQSFGIDAAAKAALCDVRVNRNNPIELTVGELEAVLADC